MPFLLFLKGLPVAWIFAGVLALFVGVYVAHCEKVKSDQANLVASLESQAAEQERRNKDTAEKQERAKEQADADAKRNTEQLHRTIKRLRDHAKRSPILPATASCAGKPETAAFNRAELDRALRDFEEGVTGLIAEGQQATVELDSVKAWAAAVK
jgi:hypothetical protein